MVWIFLPIVGLPIYAKVTKHPKRFVEHLMMRMKTSPQQALEIIFDNDAGKFVLSHAGLSISQVTAQASIDKKIFDNFSGESYEDVIKLLVDGKIWKPEATRNSLMDVNIARIGGLSQRGRIIQVIVK